MEEEKPAVDNSANSLLQDNSGGLSSTRLITVIWGGGVFLVWGFAAIVATMHGLPFPVLPPEVVTITLGITGLKVVQRFGEK